MQLAELQEIEAPLIAAWNEQDVEAVVACYTDDLVYVDPNTRGAVEGADADGTAALWRATLTNKATGKTAEIDGMDLVLLEGRRVKRNEVYYDRAPLAETLGG